MDNTQNNNYPKVLINIINTFLAIGILLILYYSIYKLVNQFYNLNTSDRFSYFGYIILNLLTIYTCGCIYLKKSWSWILFIAILIFNILSVLTVDSHLYYNRYSVYTKIIVLILLFGILLFFNLKAVVSYFRIKKRLVSLITGILISVFLLTLILILRPEKDENSISFLYLTVVNDTAYFDSTKYTGKLINYYKNGQVEIQGNIVNGIEDGLWEEFYKNGQVTSIYNYSNGILNGDIIEYYENGKIKLDGKLLNGYKELIWKEYYPNGNLRVIESYSDSLKDGEFSEFDINGKIIKEQIFKNDSLISETL